MIVFPETKEDFIKIIKAHPDGSIPVRSEFDPIKEGLQRTRGSRDHYYLRRGDRIAHIAHKYVGSPWGGTEEWSELDEHCL